MFSPNNNNCNECIQEAQLVKTVLSSTYFTLNSDKMVLLFDCHNYYDIIMLFSDNIIIGK